MKVKIDSCSIYVDGGKCEIEDDCNLDAEITGHPDDDIEVECVLISVGKVSFEIGLNDLAHALLPFRAREKERQRQL